MKKQETIRQKNSKSIQTDMLFKYSLGAITRFIGIYFKNLMLSNFNCEDCLVLLDCIISKLKIYRLYLTTNDKRLTGTVEDLDNLFVSPISKEQEFEPLYLAD